ncbi:non-ribosomal peptide synthetase [Amycolatopsis benzoatilytica]|uniref:non-ribosomal peptide synthetase n=1 Tax=Amycolatopsis benzoatilytica TaxID=346045 RepID=UPI0003699A5A|nr:non-ribosomal peptide synthetase [Amycolatopsis benzoatilytica]
MTVISAEPEQRAGAATARALRIRGPLDREKLAAALERIAARLPDDPFAAADVFPDAFANRPLDFSAPPLRARLLSLAQEEHLLLVVLPRSTHLRTGQFLAQLIAELDGSPAPGFTPVAVAPTRSHPAASRLDLAPPGTPGNAARVTTELGPRFAGQPPEVFLGAIALLLRRYTGTGAMTLGLPAGNSEHPVPLPLDLSEDQPVSIVLSDVAKALAAALDGPATTSGFEVAITIDEFLLDGLDQPSLRAFALGEDGSPSTAGGLSLQPLALRAPRCDLEIILTLRTNRPRISWLGHLPEPLLADLAADLSTLLTEILDHAERSTANLLPRARGDRAPTLDTAGAHRAHPGHVPFPADAHSIAHRFADVCRRFPGNAAIRTDTECLTYQELAARAAGTAALLRSGAGPVGLLLPHGPEHIVAIVAAVLTGRPYVPLDPHHPPDRLAALLTHAGATAILTDPAHRPLCDRIGPALTVHHLSTVERELRAADIGAAADSVAYVLYTSGSTGRPKAVAQPHANVLFQVRNHVDNFRIGPADRLGLLTSFGFDMAVTDLFSALLSGAAVVPLDVAAHGVAALGDVLARQEVTVYHSTPTMFRYLTDSLGEHRLPALRAILLGGEQVRRDDVERARRVGAPDCVFVNGYGATEISFVTQHHLGPEARVDGEVIPVGRQLPGVEVVLLDPAGRRTCLRGEITVLSKHVAPGYWRDPAASAGKFVTVDGVPAYRTGDLARRLPDGTLLHLGRADRQVKIRGYRVELGEIEAALCAQPAVAQAVAVAGQSEIIAYVAARDEQPDPELLLDALARKLPHYAVPREIVVLDTFPLTSTGKVDVRGLPAPSPTRTRRPEGDLPRAITRAWSAVLGLPDPPADKDFFALGGHSAQVPVLKRLLEKELGVEIPLGRLFDHPTITGLADVLASGLDSALDRVGDRMSRRRAARAGRRTR